MDKLIIKDKEYFNKIYNQTITDNQIAINKVIDKALTDIEYYLKNEFKRRVVI